jgi:MscS family membrane protein
VPVLVLLVALGASGLAWAGPARGATSASPLVEPRAGASVEPAPAADAEPEVAPDSPRAAIKAYLELCRAGDFAGAADYLDVPPSSKKDGPALARRLKVVLDRHVGLDLEAISPASAGRRSDRLPVGIEEIGVVPGPRPEPVRLARRGDRWVFSRATVERIDAWYDELDDRWLREHLPPSLLRPGPKGLLYWQWAVAPAVAILAWALGRVLGVATRAVLGRLAKRTRTSWDDLLVQKSGPPLTLGWALASVYAAMPWLPLDIAARAFVEAVLDAGLSLALFWLLLRAVDVTAERFLSSPKTKDEPSVRSLVPLLGAVGKVAVVALGAAAVLSELGYKVTSLLAGFGIGGIALALAAQKTVENLFGSISIGVDQPFRVGDFVKIDESLSGTVETIGLRSTRFRTLERTLVTIPNGKLADQRVESFAPRDRIRLACTLGLVHGTTAAQVRAVLAGLERVLRGRPELYPDGVVVRLREIGPRSLDVEVMVWFATPSWDEFIRIREEVLLGFLDVIEAAGTSLAGPTQPVRLVVPSELPAQRPAPAPAPAVEKRV